jgi:pyrimidine operon attenuation protein/uracil phosphoribosyltransferase
MKIFNILPSYGRYPVFFDIESANRNVKLITNTLINHYENSETNVYFIGIGSSGAIIMTLLHNYIFNHLDKTKFKGNFEYILLSKENESSHRSIIEVSNDKSINQNENNVFVIVDDCVASGNTILSIYDRIIKSGRYFEHDILSKIHWIAIFGIEDIYSDEKDVRNLKLTEKFPNLQYLIS